MEPRLTESELGRQLLAILEDSYGTGADEVKVMVGEDEVVAFFDGLGLQRNEEFLIESGYGDAVVNTRTHYQEAIETTFRAAVERSTGRRVISFASLTKLDPNYSVEIFRLAPESSGGGGPA